MNQIINFPPSFPEDERIKFCKMLQEKDDEIKNLDHEILVLENKLEKHNGGLTWKESEDLKTQSAIQKFEVDSICKQLYKFHLKPFKEFNVQGSPHLFEITLKKIGLFERLYKWLKSLMVFEIRRKES